MVVQVDHDPDAIGAHHRVDLAVVGDAAETARALVEEVEQRGAGERRCRHDQRRHHDSEDEIDRVAVDRLADDGCTAAHPREPDRRRRVGDAGQRCQDQRADERLRHRPPVRQIESRLNHPGTSGDDRCDRRQEQCGAAPPHHLPRLGATTRQLALGEGGRKLLRCVRLRVQPVERLPCRDQQQDVWDPDEGAERDGCDGRNRARKQRGDDRERCDAEASLEQQRRPTHAEVAGYDRTESDHRSEVEHVRSEHDAEAHRRRLLHDRHERRGELRAVGRERREQPDQRLGQPKGDAKAVERAGEPGRGGERNCEREREDGNIRCGGQLAHATLVPMAAARAAAGSRDERIAPCHRRSVSA
jgi:hypothetical protein